MISKKKKLEMAAVMFYFNKCFDVLPNKLSKSEIDYFISRVKCKDSPYVRISATGFGEYNFVLINEKDVLPILEKVNEQGLCTILHLNDLDSIRNIDVVKRFYDVIPYYIGKGQVVNCCSYDENRHRNACLIFEEEDLSRIRSSYIINLDETILFVDEQYSDYGGIFRSDWFFDYGIVYTDAGIYCHYSKSDAANTFFSIDNLKKDEEHWFLSWGDFNKVIYKELIFYFYSGEKLVAQIEKKILCDGLSPEKCMQLTEDLTRMTQFVNPNLLPHELAEQGRFEEAFRKAEEMINSGKDVSYGYWAKAHVKRMMEVDKMRDDPSYEKSNLFKENLEVVLKEYRKSIKIAETENLKDKKEFISFVILCIARTEYYLGHYLNSRIHFIEGLGDCYDDCKEEAVESLNEVEKMLRDIWDCFTTEFKYKDRKFIMPIRDSEIGGCIANGIATFRLSNIPSCMKFPMGHPVANQLYIGHPFTSSLYVPYEESEELFFLDKVRELRYLLECLGAEEISITSIKGKEVSELSDESLGVSGGVGIKKFSAEAEYNTQSKRQFDTSSHNQRTMTVKLDPMQRPYLPEGLIWYNEMPQWQRLVQSRLHGNLLEYSEFVSTAETKFTSSSEMTDIKASAKFLWAKVQAEVNECFEKHFKESTETQWKVDVKFRSIKDFDDAETMESETIVAEDEIVNALSEKEQDYAEEVRFCLEDGNVIDEAERRLLERKRIKWGISEERATEIERFIQQPNLTEDEQEYLDAVKDELVDGKIPEASRRLLDRLRKRMDISDERAKEIEIMAGKQ